MRRYTIFKTIRRGDIFGGITAAIVALPLALAFGVASGAGALAGLYGAIFGGFFAAIFGGTKVQVTGPTGPMTVIMTLVIMHFSPNIATAFTAVVLAGVLQILFGKLGIGRYVKLMPRPVVSGFMSGIGAIIIILQLGPILGYEAPDGAIWLKLVALPQMVQAPNGSTLFLGVLTLGITVLIPSGLRPFVPPHLAAIVVGTLAGVMFFQTVPVIGTIPSGLPTIQLAAISYGDLPHILRFALILAFLGSIDSLLTSLVADNITRSSHDSNKELVGQGIGNIASGLFGGLPGAGATMRTLVNVRAGGTSRLSGALHSVLLLVVVLGFGAAASHIPLAVLGGILVKVGIDIIDWQYLLRIRYATRPGLVIMLVTFLMTVFVDLITAVAVGFVMASVLFVARMADAQVGNAKFANGPDHLEGLSEEEREILAGAQGRIVVFCVEGPLSFGSARDMASLIQADRKKDVLAIDMSAVPFIDGSAAATLEEVIWHFKDMDDTVLLFGARERVVGLLRQTGVLQLLGEKHLLDSRIDALRLAQAIVVGRNETQ